MAHDQHRKRRSPTCAIQGRWAEAERTLEEGVALARSMPYPYAEGRLLHVYGAMHLQHVGRPSPLGAAVAPPVRRRRHVSGRHRPLGCQLLHHRERTFLPLAAAASSWLVPHQQTQH
jgi:hypothetical protein